MYREIMLPLKGLSEGLPVGNQPSGTSGHINNIRPKGVLEKRIRLGKRPGLKKAYSQQIGGETAPIVQLLSISVIA